MRTLPLGRVLLALTTLLPLAARADDFGPVHFTPPAGWQANNRSNPGGAESRLYVAPGSDPEHQAAILLVVSPKSPTKLDLRANFDQAVRGALGNRKITRASEVTSSKSRDGYDVIAQTVTATDNAGGSPLIVRCLATDVDNRLTAFCYVANDPATFDKHQAAFGALLSSTRLGDAPKPTSPLDAVSSSPPLAETPSKLQREALEAKRRELEQQIAALNAKDKEPKATAPAAADAPPPPSNVPDRAAVAKDQEARRKPGFVSGKVYDSTGRPFAIKGAKVEVHVFGTSFGGKNVGYNIAVDPSGNYEMRVPDGLYRVLCEANIPFNGETLPVTLDAADGEAFDNDVNSADRGICKDWILKLSGERAGGAERHGYNGGDFCAVDGAEAFHWFSGRGASTPQIFLTLTPTSPLLDGSKGQAIEYRCDPKTLSTVNRWPGTPIASYRVTARLVYPDGTTKPGLITTDVTGKNQSDHVDVTFRRNKDLLLGGLTTPYVYVTDVQR